MQSKPRFPRFIVADTETGVRTKGGRIKYDLIGRPENFILGAVYGLDFKAVFHDREEMIKFFESPRWKNYIVFFHNAEYDLSTLYDNIYKLDPNAVFNGSKFITATNGVVKFGDSMNILPTSVADLGNMLGIPKGTPDFNNARLSEIAEYCVNDCRIVYEALFKAFSMANAKLTIGSLSVELYRRYFLDKRYYVDTINDEFFDAYFGGRTEAFKLGKVDANVYDINSAYPYVMLTSKFPDPERIRIKENLSSRELATIMKSYEGMARVTVEIPDMHIPPLPVRHEKQLIFPTGTVTGSWVFPELRNALRNGVKIKEVHRVLFSKPIESPFKKFVTHYYMRRMETDNEFLRYYYKLLLNNLYGKLAQRSTTRSVMLHKKAKPREVMKRWGAKTAELLETEYGNFLIMQVQPRPKSHTIASWAAYITAGVRIMLYQAFTKDTLYCDTDSIFLPVGKKFPLKLSNDLGGWKKEKKRVKHIYALKDYDYIDETGNAKRKVKGVKKNSLQVSKYEFEYLRMIKTRESFRRIDGLPAGTFIKQRKKLTGNYTKRITTKNGKTKPLHL